MLSRILSGVDTPPGNTPIFIGEGAAGTSRGYSLKYRQTSGLGRLGIYL